MKWFAVLCVALMLSSCGFRGGEALMDYCSAWWQFPHGIAKADERKNSVICQERKAKQPHSST